MVINCANSKGKTVIYRGKRRPNGNVSIKRETYPPTHVSDLPLNPSLKLANHSPTGFEWGYYGSGPAQLALAILFDFTGSKERALANYQTFKEDFVARWSREPDGEWFITGGDIAVWLAKQEQPEPAGTFAGAERAEAEQDSFRYTSPNR